MKTSFASLGILAGTALLWTACLGVRGELGSEQAAPANEPQPAAVPTAATGAAPLPEAGEGAAVDGIRRIVERALPYLEEHGVAWIEEHHCTSCHQIPVMMWSFHAAASRGIEVDRDKLAEWTRWVVDDVENGRGNSDGAAHVVLGRPEGTLGKELERLAGRVASSQQADGSWKAGGQLPGQRRPPEETQRVSTGWALLALASTPDADGEVLERGRERFESWLDEDGDSLEWLVVRLLYAERFGGADRKDVLLRRLLAEQQADGGWSWLDGESSDAFATGLGLYALGRLGRRTDDPAVRRAWRFLADSQREDGSWAVRSTLRRGEGVTPTASYWGTGWATVGLLSTLEP